MSERCGEFPVCDLFVVDLEVLEEGLVKEASFGRVGLEVGGLDVVGELEGVLAAWQPVPKRQESLRLAAREDGTRPHARRSPAGCIVTG